MARSAIATHQGNNGAQMGVNDARDESGRVVRASLDAILPTMPPSRTSALGEGNGNSRGQ